MTHNLVRDQTPTRRLRKPRPGTSAAITRPLTKLPARQTTQRMPSMRSTSQTVSPPEQRSTGSPIRRLRAVVRSTCCAIQSLSTHDRTAVRGGSCRSRFASLGRDHVLSDHVRTRSGASRVRGAGTAQARSAPGPLAPICERSSPRRSHRSSRPPSPAETRTRLARNPVRRRRLPGRRSLTRRWPSMGSDLDVVIVGHVTASRRRRPSRPLRPRARPGSPGGGSPRPLRPHR